MLDLVHRAPQGPTSGAGFSVSDLSYRSDDALIDGLDLDVGAHELVAVVVDDDQTRGLLIDLFRGIVAPHHGAIRINGVELADVAIGARPPVVGPDHVQPPLALIRKVLDQYPTTLDILGPLPTEGEPDPVSLRRLALAVAIADNPDLLLLDEPTDDIDGADERLLIRAIEAACHGRSALVFTHRLSLARKASRVLVLENGRLAPFRAFGSDNHTDRWDSRVPPLIEPDSSLRVVRPDEARPSSPHRPGSPTSVGDIIDDRFRLKLLLGRSAVTDTWLADDLDHPGTVRVKVPRLPVGDDENERLVSYSAWEQLRREHDVVRSLHHPGVSQVLAASFESDLPYVAYDHVDSPSLADALAAKPDGLELFEVLQLGFELAEILHHLHRRHQVHLNLRTGHLRRRGQSVVLTDFTQCRVIGTPLPPPHRLAPSPRPQQGPGSWRPIRHYAPELQPGQTADPKMDMYALGVLLRKAAAGPDSTALLPFADLCPDTPGPVADLLDGLTAIDPEDRPDGAVVMTELRRALPAPVSLSRYSTPPPRAPQLRLVKASGAPG